MARIPLGAVVAAIALTCATLFTVLDGAPFTMLRAAVAAVAALVLVLGVWVAPVAGARALARSGPPQWQAAKKLQLVLSGLAAVLTMLLFSDNPGVAALVGILSSVFTGPSLGAGEGREQ